MIRKSTLLVLLVLSGTYCYSQSVTITGYLLYPSGSAASCTLMIASTAIGSTAGDNSVLTPQLKQATTLAATGYYSIILQANDTMIPSGTSYRVNYRCSGGPAPATEVWVVPHTPSSTSIPAIRAYSTPSVAPLFAVQQISALGIPDGYYLRAYQSRGAWWDPVSHAVSQPTANPRTLVPNVTLKPNQITAPSVPDLGCLKVVSGVATWSASCT